MLLRIRICVACTAILAAKILYEMIYNRACTTIKVDLIKNVQAGALLIALGTESMIVIVDWSLHGDRMTKTSTTSLFYMQFVKEGSKQGRKRNRQLCACAAARGAALCGAARDGNV